MLSKRFFKTKDEVEVTFHIGIDADAEGVSMVCDVHDWQPTPMKSSPDGLWKVRVRLPADRAVQFRYLATGGIWFNDEAADDYVPNGMGEDNSVVTTYRVLDASPEGHAA